MGLSQLSIRFRPIVLTIVALLMAWGAFAYFTMPRREDPEFTIRVCVITTSWPGVPARKVEELITDKIEQAVDGIEEVDLVTSTTITGQSTVNVELSDDVPPAEIQQVWDKVRARVNRVAMPSPSVRPIVNDDFGDTAILVLAIYQQPTHGRTEIRPQDRYSYRELEVFADKIRDALRLLPGVSGVDKFGIQQETIFIESDLGTWSQLKLSSQQLKELVAARNIVETGGNIDTDAGRFAVKPGGELDAVKEIESITVGMVESGSGANHVSLKDLGLRVTRSYQDPPRTMCRFGDASGSQPCVTLGLTMKSGANIIDVCTRAKQRLRKMVEVEQVLPPDISVTPVSDQSENVAAKIDDVIANVIAAVAIVGVVVLLVVGFRPAVVMSANIPVVVLASLGMITLFGVQMEQISLASIIIALGLLVDNAVQVSDQARTNQLQGMKPIEAAVSGASTMSTPMLFGTLTTVAAFIPMLFALKGSGKEYVYSLPVTLTTTLGLSWVLAMTLCVILAAALIRAPKDPTRPSSPLAIVGAMFTSVIRRLKRSKTAPPEQQPAGENLILRTYALSGRLAIGGKWITLAVAVGMFLWAVNVPVASEHFPKDRRDQFAIKIWLPESATIAQTNEKAKQVEAIIRRLSKSTDAEGNEVERLRAMRTVVGGGASRWHLAWGPEPASPNFAEILVRTTDGRFTPDMVREVRRIAEQGDEKLGLKPVSGARVVPVELPLGPPTDPVVLRIVGDGFADIGQIRDIANRVKSLVHDQPGTWDVHDSWGVSGYQLTIDVDENAANLAGVTNAQIAQTLNAYFSGLELTKFREGDHEVPVVFRLNPQQRRSIETLQAAYVEGQNGKVPLNSIAKIRKSWEISKIERRDSNRAIEVRSRVEDDVSGIDTVNRIMKSEEMKQLQSELPDGFRIEPGGAVEESGKSTIQMLTSFGISFVLIILCLVFQYNGWAKPLIILATLPLALIGALPGLYFSNNAMGFMPQLGILSLFGIVLNTGIIFIEFADILIREKVASKENPDGPIVGLTRSEFRECLIEAGKQRMLPIFLTTATTIGGLIPLALGGGPLWEGLAWCMIAGLLVATLLTLYVVPALYAILVETFGVRPVRIEA